MELTKENLNELINKAKSNNKAICGKFLNLCCEITLTDENKWNVDIFADHVSHGIKNEKIRSKVCDNKNKLYDFLNNVIPYFQFDIK